MKKEEAQHWIDLYQAVIDGKTIQCREYSNEEWKDIENPNLDSNTLLYRVKPPPIEIWVNMYTGGLATSMYITEADALNSKSINYVRTVHFKEVSDGGCW